MTIVVQADSEVAQCRYCLESDGPFVSPCLCSGTSKYVHADCLHQWRRTNPNYKDKCRECDAHYWWQHIHYGDTFVLCNSVSTLIQCGCGALTVFAVASVIIVADPRADSSTIIEPVWGGNFTAELREDTVLRVFYSVSLAGSIVYGTLWIALFTSMLTCLNSPALYFRCLGVWYTGCGVGSQYHFICMLWMGFYPAFALFMSCVFLLTLPLTFSQLMNKHNAYIASQITSSVALANHPSML